MSRTKKSPTTTVVAFDPGERTGWAVARFDPDDLDSFEILDQGVWTVVECMDGLGQLLERADVVVYETWRLYETHALAMIGNDMQPSQVVGMIRYEARQQDKTTRSQGANIKSMALSTTPPWVVKHMALSSEKHDQDAILHAWHYAFAKAHGH